MATCQGGQSPVAFNPDQMIVDAVRRYETARQRANELSNTHPDSDWANYAATAFFSAEGELVDAILIRACSIPPACCCEPRKTVHPNAGVIVDGRLYCAVVDLDLDTGIGTPTKRPRRGNTDAMVLIRVETANVHTLS